MSRHNTAYFLALADLSETLAIVALDEFVRRKDGDAMDAFMVAVLVDQDAFPWFLENKKFSYSRPTVQEPDSEFREATGYQLLLDPVRLAKGQVDLGPWQTERLEKAIAFGLALQNPTQWAMEVANHLANQAPNATAIQLLQNAVNMHNAKTAIRFQPLEGENVPAPNLVQAAIDRRPKQPHEVVTIDSLALALEAMNFPNDPMTAVPWLQAMTSAEFRQKESALFEKLSSNRRLSKFMLTMVNSDTVDGGRRLQGLKSVYEWLESHSNPNRLADLRVRGALKFFRDAPSAEIKTGLDNIQDLMGLRSEVSFCTIKNHLVALMDHAQQESREWAIDFVETVIAKNITELFPLIDGHPILNATPNASHLVGKALDGAFALEDGRAGATRLRQTLEFLVDHGHRLEHISNEKSAITHLAASIPYARPEKLAVLLSMGRDPTALDPAGKTADSFLNRTDQDAWDHVAKTFAARKTIFGLLESMDATVQPNPA